MIFKLELVSSQLNFMGCFVEDLLNLRLLRKGILQINVAAFDPLKCVDFVIKMMSIKAKSKKIKVSRQVQHNLALPTDSSGAELPILLQAGEAWLPQLLLGDERRFTQVLINLVKNALKFTHSGFIKIKLSYELRLELLVVHVEDSGEGIAESDFPKLFTRFGKLQRTA